MMMIVLTETLFSYSLQNGTTYEGEFEDNLTHGHGVTISPNGDTYDGKYARDKMHGYGVFTWADKNIYR